MKAENKKKARAVTAPVRMDEMSWPEVRGVIGGPHAVILPLGSTEQHGTHLPLNVDSVITTYVAEEAARKVVKEHEIRVIVAPTIHYTEVSHHKMFPGTIGVKADTLIRMTTDIVRAFLEQGFKNIIALTNHRENCSPLEVALTMVADEHPGARVFALCTAGPAGLGGASRSGLIKAGPAGMGHALEIETSAALVIEPQHVHLDRVVVGSRKLPLSEKFIGASGSDKSKGVIYHSGLTGFEKSGTQGDPTMASREAGERFLAAVIDDLAAIIVETARME